MGKNNRERQPIENRIYAGLIGICENKEHSTQYRGNGHHLAQELTRNVSIALLPVQQRKIFNALTSQYKSTKEIAIETGIASKNVSSQLRQIFNTTLLVGRENKGRLIKWRSY